MKIKGIRCYRPPQPNPTFNQSDMLVTVETDSGLIGIGEGGSLGRTAPSPTGEWDITSPHIRGMEFR